MTFPTRAAVYARVSTEEQDLGGQTRDLMEAAERRGLRVVKVYSDKVSARGAATREGYDRLLADARTAAFDELLVWSLDRFSREETFTRATQAILDLEKFGVRFHSLKEPALDSPPDGVPNLGRDVLLALLPVIAAFESRRRSERVRVAMREIKEGRRATRSGRPPGRQRKVTPEQVSKAAALRKSGLPWAEIAQRVGLKVETARRAVWESGRAGGTVGNPHRSQRSDSPAGVRKPGQGKRSERREGVR